MKTVALTLLLFVAASAAAAADGTPWAGGEGTVTELEAAGSGFASAVAGRPVAVVCNAPAEWASLAQQARFDAREVWGYVTFVGERPGDEANLSSTACTYLQAFARAPDKRSVTIRCRTGTRLLVTGRRQAVYGECPDYLHVLSALGTLAHESVHLRGFREEGVAECYALQLVGAAARRLGAGGTLALRLAGDYWRRVYRALPAESRYARADCVDGGALDLDRASASWPAGDGAPALPAP